jgi:hypothetical protein
MISHPEGVVEVIELAVAAGGGDGFDVAENGLYNCCWLIREAGRNHRNRELKSGALRHICRRPQPSPVRFDD